ncbi:MAG: sugar ABC transporter ATP-binding protein [Anaerolineae bacterium]|nr:sugar ABC transporter ATP-binding protein [Anaerolineales bacterium]MCQ3976125.1 sugar ABC transporter ATP-binding protein [Anaerolineae bacterium]
MTDLPEPSNETAVRPLVEAIEVTKYYAGVTALDKANFSCQAGSIHALIGENGAGKSTLIKILTGVITPDAGVLKIDGQTVTLDSPMKAGQLGIVPVFQELSLLPHLTVAENIFITNPPRSRLGLIDRRALNGQTEQLFDSFGFHHLDPEALLSELPLAQRQMVEIAKALSRQPRLLILDEGTSALTIREVKLVFQVMERMRQQNRSVIFISHRMAEIEEIADTITIFRDGQDVGMFPAGAVNHDELVQRMIGRKLEQVFPEKSLRPPQQKPLLEVKDLSWEHVLHSINFSLGQGEILGFGGLEGQGQGELLFALFGVLRNLQGSIYIEGKPTRINSPAAAAQAGIGLAFIPEDRKTEGLLLPMSVGDNITIATLDRRTHRLGLVDKRREKSAIQRMIDQLKIRTASPHIPVRNLSGGNQQKVVIAKWLLTQARILLLYDLTRGIDVGTKQELYQLMRTLADEGAAILFFSTELAELVGMCDRVLVLYEGQIQRELKGPEITEENLVAAALGLNAGNGKIGG